MNGEPPIRPADKPPANAALGCLKWLGIGCIILFLLVVTLAIVLIINRDAIRESSWFRSASEKAGQIGSEMSSLVNLSRELSARYPAESIGVSMKMESGEGTRLEINVRNPKFEFEAGEEMKAREIAAASLELHPQIAEYETVRIVFERSTGGTISVSSTEHYDILVGDLIAERDGARQPPMEGDGSDLPESMDSPPESEDGSR